MTAIKKQIILGITLISLFACGPSKEQQAAEEKRKLDSTAQVATQNAKTELLREQATQDSIKQNKMIQAAEVEGKQNRLIEMKGRLAGALSKMQDIQSYHFGRTHAEKEMQIEQQTKVIEALKTEIDELEKELEK